MKLKHRSAIILVTMLLLLFTAVPVSAATVCKIGSKGYASLAKAVNAAKSGQTITVSKAVKTDEEVHINKKLVIDFAGKKYTYNGEEPGTSAFHIDGSAVTFKNMNISAKTSGGITIHGGGSVTITGGKYAGGIISNEPGGKITIKGGSFVFNHTAPEGVDRGDFIHNGGTCKITGGTFSSKDKDPNGNPASAMFNPGTCVITKATFKNPIYSPGKLTISGGKFNGTIGCDSGFGSGHKVTIEGGTFKHLDIRNGGKAVIKGGKFPEIFAVNVHDGGSSIKVTGGTFTGIQCYEGGTLTLSGGKNTGPVISGGAGAKVTINKHTVNIERVIQPLPNVVLIADGGNIIVNGGSFTNKTGSGYMERNNGKVIFSVSDPGKLFDVKELVLSE